MDNRLLLFACIVLIAGLLVWLGRYTAMKKFVRGRRPLSVQEIHQTIAPGISLDTLAQVYDVLGTAYGVAPTLIRPGDSFKDFFDLDSWHLDTGTEKVNEWLESQAIQKPSGQLATVLDLLRLVESGRSSRDGK